MNRYGMTDRQTRLWNWFWDAWVKQHEAFLATLDERQRQGLEDAMVKAWLNGHGSGFSQAELQSAHEA